MKFSLHIDCKETGSTMIKRLAIIFIAIILCFCVVACGGSNSIIGEWNVTVDGGIKTIIFKNDGAYTVVKENGEIEEDGTFKVDGDKLVFTSAYRIEGDKSLNLQEDSDDIFTFEIKGKTLTLTSKHGESLDFTRK